MLAFLALGTPMQACAQDVELANIRAEGAIEVTLPVTDASAISESTAQPSFLTAVTDFTDAASSSASMVDPPPAVAATDVSSFAANSGAIPEPPAVESLPLDTLQSAISVPTTQPPFLTAVGDPTSSTVSEVGPLPVIATTSANEASPLLQSIADTVAAESLPPAEPAVQTASFASTQPPPLTTVADTVASMPEPLPAVAAMDASSFASIPTAMPDTPAVESSPLAALQSAISVPTPQPPFLTAVGDVASSTVSEVDPLPAMATTSASSIASLLQSITDTVAAESLPPVEPAVQTVSFAPTQPPPLTTVADAVASMPEPLPAVVATDASSFASIPAAMPDTPAVETSPLAALQSAISAPTPQPPVLTAVGDVTSGTVSEVGPLPAIATTSASSIASLLQSITDTVAAQSLPPAEPAVQTASFAPTQPPPFTTVSDTVASVPEPLPAVAATDASSTPSLPQTIPDTAAEDTASLVNTPEPLPAASASDAPSSLADSVQSMLGTSPQEPAAVAPAVSAASDVVQVPDVAAVEPSPIAAASDAAAAAADAAASMFDAAVQAAEAAEASVASADSTTIIIGALGIGAVLGLLSMVTQFIADAEEKRLVLQAMQRHEEMKGAGSLAAADEDFSVSIDDDFYLDAERAGGPVALPVAQQNVLPRQEDLMMESFKPISTMRVEIPARSPSPSPSRAQHAPDTYVDLAHDAIANGAPPPSGSAASGPAAAEDATSEKAEEKRESKKGLSSGAVPAAIKNGAPRSPSQVNPASAADEKRDATNGNVKVQGTQASGLSSPTEAAAPPPEDTSSAVENPATGPEASASSAPSEVAVTPPAEDTSSSLEIPATKLEASAASAPSKAAVNAPAEDTSSSVEVPATKPEASATSAPSETVIKPPAEDASSSVEIPATKLEASAASAPSKAVVTAPAEDTSSSVGIPAPKPEATAASAPSQAVVSSPVDVTSSTTEIPATKPEASADSAPSEAVVTPLAKDASSSIEVLKPRPTSEVVADWEARAYKKYKEAPPFSVRAALAAAEERAKDKSGAELNDTAVTDESANEQEASQADAQAVKDAAAETTELVITEQDASQADAEGVAGTAAKESNLAAEKPQASGAREDADAKASDLSAKELNASQAGARAVEDANARESDVVAKDTDVPQAGARAAEDDASEEPDLKQRLAEGIEIAGSGASGDEGLEMAATSAVAAAEEPDTPEALSETRLFSEESALSIAADESSAPVITGAASERDDTVETPKDVISKASVTESTEADALATSKLKGEGEKPAAGVDDKAVKPAASRGADAVLSAVEEAVLGGGQVDNVATAAKEVAALQPAAAVLASLGSAVGSSAADDTVVAAEKEVSEGSGAADSSAAAVDKEHDAEADKDLSQPLPEAGVSSDASKASEASTETEAPVSAVKEGTTKEATPIQGADRGTKPAVLEEPAEATKKAPAVSEAVSEKKPASDALLEAVEQMPLGDSDLANVLAATGDEGKRELADIVKDAAADVPAADALLAAVEESALGGTQVGDVVAAAIDAEADEQAAITAAADHSNEEDAGADSAVEGTSTPAAAPPLKTPLAELLRTNRDIVAELLARYAAPEPSAEAPPAASVGDVMAAAAEQPVQRKRGAGNVRKATAGKETADETARLDAMRNASAGGSGEASVKASEGAPISGGEQPQSAVPMQELVAAFEGLVAAAPEDSEDVEKLARMPVNDLVATLEGIVNTSGTEPSQRAAGPVPANTAEKPAYGAAAARIEPEQQASTSITLVYFTGWEKPAVHASVLGGKWTTYPMEKVSAGQAQWTIDVKGRAQWFSKGRPVMEFVITDGQGNWDNPIDGSNYKIPSLGTFQLVDGNLTEL